MVLHHALRARNVRKVGIGGDVRHGVTSGVSFETSLNEHVTPHLHREEIHQVFANAHAHPGRNSTSRNQECVSHECSGAPCQGPPHYELRYPHLAVFV